MEKVKPLTKREAKEYLKELEEEHRQFFKNRKDCFRYNGPGKSWFSKPEYAQEHAELMEKIKNVTLFLVPKKRQKSEV